MELVRNSVVNIFILRSRVVLEHPKHLPAYATVVLGLINVQSAKGVLKPPKHPLATPLRVVECTLYTIIIYLAT